jgi:hypothetical protein
MQLLNFQADACASLMGPRCCAAHLLVLADGTLQLSSTSKRIACQAQLHSQQPRNRHE